jgi:hypothetical protein
MRVVSRLVNMDFQIGRMERKDDQILITSHPSQPMKTKVYMDPEDAVDLIKSALNWSVISFALSLPFLYAKSKRENKNEAKA